MYPRLTSGYCGIFIKSLISFKNEQAGFVTQKFSKKRYLRVKSIQLKEGSLNNLSHQNSAEKDHPV